MITLSIILLFTATLAGTLIFITKKEAQANKEINKLIEDIKKICNETNDL